jgi:hypothetical protein
MFDIIGGFVVKLHTAGAGAEVRARLHGFGFTCIELDGTRLTDKTALHAELYRAMDLAALAGPFNGRANWDSLSDYLWQWVQDESRTVTKLAFVIENGSAFLAASQIAFEFAETCVHLEEIVREARRKDGEPPLLVRVLLIG